MTDYLGDAQGKAIVAGSQYVWLSEVRLHPVKSVLVGNDGQRDHGCSL